MTNAPLESEHSMAPIVAVGSVSALQSHSHTGREGAKLLNILRATTV